MEGVFIYIPLFHLCILPAVIFQIPIISYEMVTDTMKILIVEDNLPNMTYAQFLLKKLGYEFISAFSGEEALEMLKTQNVDYMLIDINLGEGISGLEFLKAVRKKKCLNNVPAIAVTAYAMNGDKDKFINEGFDDYLPKPYTFNDFKKVLQKNMVSQLEW